MFPLEAFQPQLLPKSVPTCPESLHEYCFRGGYTALRNELSRADPDEIIRQLTASGLRGKGGASFPTGKKWEMVCAEARPRYVVCNGGEHEPGSRKDTFLMTYYPHSVLEGLLVAAVTLEANAAYVYITEDQKEALTSMREAIAELTRSGLLVVPCPVICIAGPSTYVSGEETAALNAIEGSIAQPRQKPPFPTTRGLWGRPTAVNNVETLATIALIARRGAHWFRNTGTHSSPGTALVTLTRGVRRPGVYEVPYGATIREIVDHCGGGTALDAPVKAILPGGPSLPFLRGDMIDTPFDHDSLKAVGSGPGCGAIRLWFEGECMVEATLELAEFFGNEQCGQCAACRMETNTIVTSLQKVVAGTGGRAALQKIQKVTAYARGKGLCSLIAMAAVPVLSAIQLFTSDFEHHIDQKVCSQHAQQVGVASE